MSVAAVLPVGVQRAEEARQPAMETFGDLLEALGGVSPARVIMHPAPGTATEDDVIWYEGRANKRLCELIDGTLVEKAMGLRESMFARHVATKLDGVVAPNNLGLVATADCFVRMVSGRLRIPDVAYFPWDRLPNRAWPSEPVSRLAPALAVEILSESNTDDEMRMKRQDYFASGVNLVWEIELKLRRVRVYTSVEDFKELMGSDQLDGGTVLPGFSLPLPQFFGELDRHG